MSSERKRLPNRRTGIRVAISKGSEKVYLCTGNYEDGSLGEIFLDMSKQGTFSRAMLNAFAIAVSVGLQHGVPLSAFQHSYRDFKMEPDIIRDIFAELALSYENK